MGNRVSINLRRPETWDRIFVVNQVISWVVAFFIIASKWDTITARAQRLGGGPWIPFLIALAGFLVLEFLMLRAIWNHRPWGFVCQLVLSLLTLSSLPTWGIRSWIEVPLVVTFTVVRLYQLKATTATLR
ncbi:MAG: hypothetical protein M3R13_10790 [Armatimonadota bacterium]|nr:hypothetical protein [Armatimonadota bacterium]